MFRTAVLAAAALATLAVVAMPAIAAKGGNSANAKKCQKGAWENYVRADQTPFTSEQDCTGYAAKGGVLTEPQTASAAQTLCENAGYTFETGLLDLTESGDGLSYFRCTIGEFSIGRQLAFEVSYRQNADVLAECATYDAGGVLLGVFVDDRVGVHCRTPRATT